MRPGRLWPLLFGGACQYHGRKKAWQWDAIRARAHCSTARVAARRSRLKSRPQRSGSSERGAAVVFELSPV